MIRRLPYSSQCIKHYVMKRLVISYVVLIPILATSCIFDAPGDDFYRTLWKSEEVSQGPIEASSISLEFLCNGGVLIKLISLPDEDLDSTENLSFGQSRQAYKITRSITGTYTPDGSRVVFDRLSTTILGYNVSFLEAHRSGDTLFLLWNLANSATPFTTVLHRKSSYD